MIIQPPLGLKERIGALLERNDDWNGNGLPTPNPSAVSYAQGWIVYFYTTIIHANDLNWLDPEVSSDHEGSVELFWELNGKSLYLSVGPLSVDFEAATKTEEVSGNVDSAYKSKTLWEWLIDPSNDKYFDRRSLDELEGRKQHRSLLADRILDQAALVADAFRQRVDMDPEDLKAAMSSLSDSVADLRRLQVI